MACHPPRERTSRHSSPIGEWAWPVRRRAKRHKRESEPVGRIYGQPNEPPPVDFRDWTRISDFLTRRIIHNMGFLLPSELGPSLRPAAFRAVSSNTSLVRPTWHERFGLSLGHPVRRQQRAGTIVKRPSPRTQPLRKGGLHRSPALGVYWVLTRLSRH